MYNHILGHGSSCSNVELVYKCSSLLLQGQSPLHKLHICQQGLSGDLEAAGGLHITTKLV